MTHELSVGWVLASDLDNTRLMATYGRARDILLDLLREQIPEVEWSMPFVERRIHPPFGALSPLALLESGSYEKLARGWDFALVVVPNELIPWQEPATIGIPSSPLEVAVLSSSRLGRDDMVPIRMAGLALHLLGHLWDLDHADSGPMRPVDDPLELQAEHFSDEECSVLRDRLVQLSGARLEEGQQKLSVCQFYLQTFRRDARGILSDVVDAAPWKIPLYLGRLTAAAALSTIFLLLSADGWALIPYLKWNWTGFFAVSATVVSAVSVFVGQSVGHPGRLSAHAEQMVRTREVLMGILLTGMASLWGFLFLITFFFASLIPDAVLELWADLKDPTLTGRMIYSAFVATLGVLAASLGGNLEEPEELKAELFFDEET